MPETEPVKTEAAPPEVPAEAPKPVDPKPKSEASRKYLESISAVQKTRAEQVKVKAELEKNQALITEAQQFKALQAKITEAKAANNIPEVHRLLGIQSEATAAFLANGGAPKEDKFTQLERELKATQDRLASFEAEKVKAQEAIGNKEREALEASYIEDIHSQVETYPLIALLKQGPFVLDRIKQLAKEGKTLDPEKVMADIEERFMLTLESVADNPKGLEKLLAVIAKKQKTEKKEAKAAKESEEPKMKAEREITPIKTVTFGSGKSVLQKALEDASAETAAKKK